MATVGRMKMRRTVIIVEHGNHDSQESADSGILWILPKTSGICVADVFTVAGSNAARAAGR